MTRMTATGLDNSLCLLLQKEYKAEIEFTTKQINKNLRDNHTVKFILDGFEPSSILFPTIINKYLTGSRAEYLYKSDSDYDNFYEIGPGLVRDFRDKQLDDGFQGFYCKQSENPGFYTVEDANGKFLYPQIVQQKLAPLFLTKADQNGEYVDRYRRALYEDYHDLKMDQAKDNQALKDKNYNFEDTEKTCAAISSTQTRIMSLDFVLRNGQ
eukprot:TCONS_00023705-protein